MPGMRSLPTLDVVVLNWNTRGLCDAVLTQLRPLADEAGVTVFVVDNGSSDGSDEHLAAAHPWARLIRSERNLGYAGGMNLGLRAGQGEAVLLLNSDVELPELEAIAHLRQVLRDDPRCGAVGPALVFPDGRFQTGAGGWDLGLVTAFNHFFFLSRASRRVPSLYLHQPHWADAADPSPVEVEWIAGTALLARREALERVGGVPTDSFLYAEDIQLGRALRAAGYRLRYAPSARVVHRQGGAQAGPNGRWVTATLEDHARRSAPWEQVLMRSIFGVGLLTRYAAYRVAGDRERAEAMKRYVRAVLTRS